MNASIGSATNRVDGVAKLSGVANYAADVELSRLAHAVLVQSTIAKGQIGSIDAKKAQAAPGVLLVMTYLNAPRLPAAAQKSNPPADRALSLLQDNQVRYNGEPIAVIVAESFEQAQYAATLLEINYARAAAAIDFDAALPDAYKPDALTGAKPDSARGDADAGMSSAPTRISEIYSTPIEVHNPMEPHATLAQWNGDSLTVHDSTQGVVGARQALAKKLGIPVEKVRVLSPYVGGGFGGKGSAWSHVVLAAMAARQVRRPVRLALQRTQMFGPVGYRPRTRQHIALGADANGTLVAIKHDVISATSTFEDWGESSAILTRMLYACANTSTSHRLIKQNLGTPTFQRAPGESSGSFALETAMDELAWKLELDPLELRLRNYAEVEPETGKPWSSKALRECYRSASERFGWGRRSASIGALREGDLHIGYGMATATYPANRKAANALVRVLADGSALVQCATQDIGTGTYTIITQVAGEVLGLAATRIKVEIGDSQLPEAPVSGGSMTSASVMPAVREAAKLARNELLALAVADPASRLHGLDTSALTVEDGWISAAGNASQRESFAAVIARNGSRAVEAKTEAKPGEAKDFAMHSFGAVFVEVAVDPLLGQVRVRRVVANYGVGTILNSKTAHSQLLGGVVWGIGMALHENAIVDANEGRVLNANLAQYHVPVNADIPDLDVAFVVENDQRFNSLGAKGVGEIGITGVAAAIGNAIYHATGRRIRDLPFSPEKFFRAV